MRGPGNQTLATLFLMAFSLAEPGLTQVRSDDAGRLKPLPKLIEALGAKPGARIADVGSGDGFYSLQIASAVLPGGRVTATDIDAEGLVRLKTHIENGKVTNIDVVQGRPDDPLLEPNTLDAALIRNAYHEMTEHQAMLRHIREALKPGGRLVVADRLLHNQREMSRADQAAVHQIAPAFVVADLLAAGFKILRLNQAFEPFGEAKNPGAYWLIVAVAPTK